MPIYEMKIQVEAPTSTHATQKVLATGATLASGVKAVPGQFEVTLVRTCLVERKYMVTAGDYDTAYDMALDAAMQDSWANATPRSGTLGVIAIDKGKRV